VASLIVDRLHAEAQERCGMYRFGVSIGFLVSWVLHFSRVLPDLICG
jgi:hypothetical protein